MRQAQQWAMIDLDRIASFVAVAEELSFTRAAEHVRRDPSRLSRHIRELEAELGCRLFARTTRQVSLTEPGRTLLDAARPLLAAAETVAATMRGLRDGPRRREVRVGALYSLHSARRSALLERFVARFPDADVTVKYGMTPALIEQLRAGAFDVIFANEPFSRHGLVAVPFQRHRLQIILPTEAPEATLGEVPFAALAGRSVHIVPRHLSPPLHASIYDALDHVGASLVAFAEVEPESVVRFARNSGVWVLTFGISGGLLHDSGLVIRPVADEAMWRDSHVVRRSGAADTMLEWLFDRAAQMHRWPVEASGEKRG